MLISTSKGLTCLTLPRTSLPLSSSSIDDATEGCDYVYHLDSICSSSHLHANGSGDLFVSSKSTPEGMVGSIHTLSDGTLVGHLRDENSNDNLANRRLNNNEKVEVVAEKDVEADVKFSKSQSLSLTSVHANALLTVKTGKKISLVFYEKNGLKRRTVRVPPLFLAPFSEDEIHPLLERPPSSPSSSSSKSKPPLTVNHFDFNSTSNIIVITTSSSTATLTSVLRINNSTLQCFGTILWPPSSSYSSISISGSNTTLKISTCHTCLSSYHYLTYSLKLHDFNVRGSINTVYNSEEINVTDYKKGLIPEPMYSRTLRFGTGRIFVNRVDLRGDEGCADLGCGKVGRIEGDKVGEVWDGFGGVVGGGKVYFIEGKKVKQAWEGRVEEVVREGGIRFLKSFEGGVCVVREDDVVELIDEDMKTIKEINTLEEAEKVDVVGGHLIYLSEGGRLYVGDYCVCGECGGYEVCEDMGYLIYMEEGEEWAVGFWDLKRLETLEDMLGVDDFDVPIQRRVVDNNTKLISVIAEKSMVVLRHARGNFEGIYPRPLVLRTVRNLIVNGEWGKAFDVCKRMKVDLNFLCDYRWREFLEGGEKFVEQVGKKTDNLNLFISMLQDVDFARTKYMDPDEEPPTTSDTDQAEQLEFFNNKTNRICAHLKTIMLENVKKYLLPLLSTYAKSPPPLLSKALELIKSQTSNLNSAYAQDAFKYLAFLAKYTTIYTTALGMYDFDLAKAVGRNSQMDPKVYLKELKGLVDMEPAKARYTVDVKLERWESAVRNLKECGDVEECLKMIEEKDLIGLGLEIFEAGEERKKIMGTLARKMVKEGKAEAAISVYLSVGDYDGAVSTARTYGDWKTVVTYFKEIDQGDEEGARGEDWMGMGGGGVEEFDDVVEEMVALLEGKTGDEGRKGAFEAAQLLVEYSEAEDKYDRAVKLLCEG